LKKYIWSIFLLVGIAVSCGLFLGTGQVESLASSGTAAADLISGKPQQLPIAGMVTMVDIGAHSCIPCKMMTPIIEELSKEYEGRAAIAFIDVWEYQEEAGKYGIRAIPTQIFYDAEGNERFRHEGFMDKESIVKKLKELGVS
jgi:thioredoxin 1